MEMVLIATPTPSDAAYSDKMETNVILWVTALSPLLPRSFGMVSRKLHF